MPVPNSRRGKGKTGLRRLKVMDSQDITETIEDHQVLYDFVDNLKSQIEKDPTTAIDSCVLGNRRSNEYLLRQKMQPKEKVGDIIVPSSNIEQLIDMIRRHYKFVNNEARGKREIREVKQVFLGTLTDNREYQDKKKKRLQRE